MSVHSERPGTPATAEPGKSSQVLLGSGQPQDRYQGCLCMCALRIFFRLHLPIFDHPCRDSIVGRASDFPSPFHISHDRRFPSSVTVPAHWPN